MKLKELAEVLNDLVAQGDGDADVVACDYEGNRTPVTDCDVIDRLRDGKKTSTFELYVEAVLG